MKWDLVIFDCDGVLVDSETISCGAAVEAFAEQGFTIPVEQYIQEFSGKSRASVMASVEETLGERLPAGFSEQLEEKILAAFSRGLKSIRDVDVLINASPSRCIASGSSFRRILHSLRATRLDKYFDVSQIFSSAMVKRGKPDPELLFYAANKMHADPKRCIVIEDSVAGATAAQRAGMSCFGFVGGQHIVDRSVQKTRLVESGAVKVFQDMSSLAEAIKIYQSM